MYILEKIERFSKSCVWKMTVSGKIRWGMQLAKKVKIFTMTLVVQRVVIIQVISQHEI